MLPPGLDPPLSDILKTISLLISAIGIFGAVVGLDFVGFGASVGIGRIVCGFVMGVAETGLRGRVGGCGDALLWDNSRTLLNIFELPGVSGTGAFEATSGEGNFGACHVVFEAAAAGAGFDIGGVVTLGRGAVDAFVAGIGTGLLGTGTATTFSAFFAGIFLGGAETLAWMLLITFFAASLAFFSNSTFNGVDLVAVITEPFADVVGLGAAGVVVAFATFTAFGCAGVVAVGAVFVDFALVVVFFTASGNSTPTASTTTFLGLPLFFATTSADISNAIWVYDQLVGLKESVKMSC